MAAKGTEEVVVRRAPTKDRLGDVVPGEVVGTLTRCIVWPRSSSEDSNRGIVTIEGLTVFVPAPVATMPLGSDVVEVRGQTHQIEGAVGDWRKKNGRKVGIMFETTRYSG